MEFIEIIFILNESSTENNLMLEILSANHENIHIIRLVNINPSKLEIHVMIKCVKN
jgi:hypothetical protein